MRTRRPITQDEEIHIVKALGQNIVTDIKDLPKGEDFIWNKLTKGMCYDQKLHTMVCLFIIYLGQANPSQTEGSSCHENQSFFWHISDDACHSC